MRTTSYRFLTLLCLLSLGISTLFAVPAYRGWRTMTQPDGSTITIRQMGDEFFHYWENEAGQQVEEDAQGYWHVLETPVVESQLQKKMRASRHYTQVKKSGQPAKVGGVNLAPRGLVILVNFSDVAYQSYNTKAAMSELMNSENYTYNSATGSVREFFKAQSNGQYVPDFDVVGPYTLANNRAHYGANSGAAGTDVLAGDMVIEACKAADADGVDFTKYNNDGDTYVDFVYVIYAGVGEADANPKVPNSIWPHNWTIASARYYGNCTYTASQCKVDGLTINNYACSGELTGNASNRCPIGTITHEFGHVLGLPDYYVTDEDASNEGKNYTPGAWHIMDYGSYNNSGRTPPNYTPHDKYFFGWATPTLLAKNEKKNCTLTTTYGSAYQINGGTTLKAATDESRVWYLENRQKSGWDTYLPGHGMVVWEVNYNSTDWSNNEPNNENVGYTVVTANSLTRPYTPCVYNTTASSTSGTTFPGTSNVTSYTPTSGCALTEIIESGGNITFKYNGGQAKWSYALLGENCTYPSDGEVNFNASLSLTITPDAGYTLADAACWEVTMGSTTLTYGTDFTYNSSTNTFYIPSVTGDVEMYIYGGRPVTWMANGSEFTTNMSIGDKITLPATNPSDCSGTGGKKFVGWCTNSSYSHATTAPTFAKTGDAYTVATYYAVYATAGSGGSGTATYTFVIDKDDFTNSGGYAANNGEHTSTAVDVDDNTNTLDVTWTSNQVYQNGDMQWQKSNGYIYNNTDLGKINSVTVSTVSGSFTTYYGTSEEPTNTTLGTSDGYFKVVTGTSSAGHTNSITVNFTQSSTGGTSYSDYSTTCAACTLTGITLNTSGATTTFTQGQTFTSEGLVVTASYSDCSDRTVSPTSVSSPDMSVVGTGKTVTVSYTEGEVTKTATYTIDITAAPTYTIRFFDGTTQIGANQEVTSGQSATKPSDPADCTDNGYTFVGWYTSKLADDNTTVTSGWITDFTVSAAQDYYAVYSHTETSGSGSSATYEFSITTGDFSGSSYSANDGAHTSTAYDVTDNTNTMSVSWTSSNVSNQSGTQWKKNGSYIYNDTDLGKINSVTITGDALTKYYGTASNPSNSTLGANDGYFKVTNETSGALHTTSITVNFTISSGGGTSTTYYVGTKDCTLPTEVTITFHKNDGTDATTSQTIDYNTATNLTANTFSREGYTFQGWATSASGEKVHNDQASVTLTKNTDLYAVWQKNSYNVTFTVPTGATAVTVNGEATSPQSAAYGSTVTIAVTPASTHTVNGVSVTGGLTVTDNGNNTYSFTMPNNEVTVTVTMVEKETFAIKFFNNGTQIGTTQNKYAGETPDVPSNPTACEGYTFVGWWTAELATTNTTAQTWITDFTVSGAQNYYAVYRRTETSGGGSSTTYTLELHGSDFVQNYNERSSSATANEDGGTGTFAVEFTSDGVMKSSNSGNPIQFRKSGSGAGVLYNTTDLGTINSITYGSESTNNIASTYKGSSEQPTSDGTGGYFKITNGSSVSYITSITINFTTSSGGGSSTTYYSTTAECSGLHVSPKTLNFGEKALNSSTDLKLTVTGSELTENATLSLSGDNAEMFSVTPTTLTQSAGTISGSENVTVTYKPTAGGSHSATLTITSGSSTKTVTLSGTCTLSCVTPTLSFSKSTETKLLGSGTFTLTATSPDNTLDAAITYSSDKTDKATVDPNTGEVTLKEATGSGSPVSITATMEAKSDGTKCQEQVTASYELTIYNKVTWLVGEDEYTGGSPTTQTSQGGQISTFPADPDGDALCGGKVFIGWTDHTVADPVDVAPTPMYKKLSDLSSVYINANKTFYAVFAATSTAPGTGNYLLVESDPGDANWAGDYLIAYDATTFADGRIGGKDDSGSIGEQSSSVNPDDNLSGKTVAGTWGDTYNVTISKIGSTNTYLLQTKDGKYNYQSSNNNGLVATTNKSTAEGYPLTITFNSSSDIAITVPSGPVFHYNTQDYFRFYKSGGQENVYLYKKDGGGTTYSDFSTTCGTCLPAPAAPTVTPKSNRATITWTAVPDATGYTVTCTGGTVSVVGTTATITGLTSETTYSFSIRSQGGDPYTCFPAYNGSFTTTSCEDSPVLGTVTVTTTSATIPWTCEAATATVLVYTDAECTDQVGSDHTLCTSPYTITTLVSNTTYYYKVLAGGTCPSVVGSFKTEEIKLDIAEWKPDAVVVSFNGDADLTLTTYTEETHGDPHANVADDIFFSKYYEAAASVKLLAIFNGTMNSVDLSNYELGLAQSGSGISNTSKFSFKKFSEFEKSSGGGLTADELLLKSNEELIIITYTAAETDQHIIKCAKDDEENSKFSKYIRVSTPNLQFNGDDVVCLKNPDGDLIDLVGAGTKDGGSDRSGASFETTSSSGSYHGFMDSPGGWYTTHGYRANADNTETEGYALSSNRCLLIRRKHVKSGHNAVLHNETDFLTLGDYTYMGADYEGEWKGLQIPGSTTEGTKPGLDNSCDGFNIVGSYNYNDYYVDFEPTGVPTTFDDLKSDPFDGTYVIPVTGLSDKECTLVRIELKDGNGDLVIRKDVKVPIMVNDNIDTKNSIFTRNNKDAAICRECDVIILNGATLTKADGSAGDVNEVRDMKIYQGGTLVVPSGRDYTVNSLSLRRQEDEVASAKIVGTLNVLTDDATYLDVRIDPTNWHYFTLPYNCKVSDVTFADGTPATVGVDFLLCSYDGEHRAATKSTSWKDLTTTDVLKKGIGYIIALPGDGIVKREIRFPMANTVLTAEQDDKMIDDLHAWGGNDAELRPNHKGWNLIGNPYMMYYNLPDMTTPLAAGTLIPDPDEPAKYIIEEGSDNLYYIVVPQDNGWSEYLQTTIGGFDMPPFTSYFVQLGGNPDENKSIEFVTANKEDGPSPVIRRAPAEDIVDNHEVWFGVDLINTDGESDETTLLMSDKFTNDYDMMRDLVKMRGTYYTYYTKPVLASRNNEGEMAFNALPDSTAAAGVPLSFFAAADGQYRFTVSAHYSLDEVKEAYLYDNDNADAKWHNLLEEDYVFDAKRGDNTTRFLLAVKVERKQPEITTSMDNLHKGLVLTTVNRTLMLSGLTNDADIYVYDVSGKLLDARLHYSSTSGIFRTTVNTAGLYFVRVKTPDGQQTLETVVY